MSEKINTKVVQVNETIEKEKNDVLENIQTFCATLEGNVQSNLQKNNNELEMLTLKLYNERKEVEIEIREDKPDNVKHNHENTFVNMFNNLGEKIKNLQEKIDTEVKKTQASKNILEESLNLNLHWYLNCLI